MTIAYSMTGDKAVEAQLPGLVSGAVSKLYEKYASAKNGGDRAKVFHRSGNSLVSESIDDLGIEVDEVTTWHEVRDELFKHGKIREAHICHRKAMPILQDVIGIVSGEEMREEYPDEINGVSVLKMFSRMIREAIEMFPMLCGETKFELGESRVISLDMEDIVPREQTDRAIWKASIAFFVGYDILTRDFFFHEDYVKLCPKQYQHYHAVRAKRIKTARKRFSMDERQRFAKITSAQSQVDSLIAEGRKNFVDILVASQLFEHHTDQSIKLSSTVIILGAGNMSKEESEMVTTRFDLTKSQMNVIRRIRPPTPKGAEAFMIFRTRDGNQAQHVLFSDGPLYLWLITTEAVDRQMRSLMYELHGTEEGLRRLAKRYPGGSIKKELQNRMAEADEVDGSDESMGNLIEELAENC
jgi:intracellular multiplication protein IcmB